MTDTAALIATRTILRRAYTEIRALSQDDPSVRCTLTALDEMCTDLTNEIEAVEPRLALGRAA